MTKWVLSGLRAGIRTTRYPLQPDKTSGVSPGFPSGRGLAEGDSGEVVDHCPTGALLRRADRIAVDPRRCIHCFRCARAKDAVTWEPGYEWAMSSGGGLLTSPFRRSVHVRVVDAGDCGACLHEVKQIANPYYNAHRLGFFFTPTPRQADVLLVVGPGTDQMRTALEKAYAAMPTPRRVIAAGACALSGGIFGPSFACGDGVRSIVPVDIEVPGDPPPPLAILHALLVVTGRAPPAEMGSQDDEPPPGDELRKGHGT
jgi:Ni,Fe-hydrogenase III small subunit